MFALAIVVLAIFSSYITCQDYASQQLLIYSQNHTGPPEVLTTSYGVPIEKCVATKSLNTNLIRNKYFLDSVTHLVKEKIPVRTVHAKGTGAFGYLEITNDISKYCRAKVFSEVGKKIPLVARLSFSSGDKGDADTKRSTRGFAVKLYTEGGNLDILCLSSPMYTYKDPLLFPAFLHSIQRNPATALTDVNAVLDYITLRPESLFFYMFVLSDRGIPDGFRHMAAFNIQTLQVVNKDGDSYFLRFHFLPDAGIKNLTQAEALKIAAADPDYAIRDLYNAIASGNFPSWTMYAQILSLEQVLNSKFNVFDVTNILPVVDFPLTEVGKLVLNENPVNQHAQIEQLAFNPGNLPDGFVGGPGKIFEARQLIYMDAHSYRLGSNFNKIPVNCPLHQANTYNRDGVAPVGKNGEDSPNYYPNSFGGYAPIENQNTPDLFNTHEKEEAENFQNARDFYDNELSTEDRNRLIGNIVRLMSRADQKLQVKILRLLAKFHADFEHKVRLALQDRQNSPK